VAVNDASVVELVVVADSAGAVPVEKVLVDEFAIGMVADGAFARVALVGRFRFGVGGKRAALMAAFGVFRANGESDLGGGL